MDIKNLKYSFSVFMLATGITLMSSGCTHQPKIESEVVEETVLDLEEEKQLEEERMLKSLLFDGNVESFFLHPTKLSQIKESFPDWSTEELYQRISDLLISMPELKRVEVKDFSDQFESVSAFSKKDLDYLSKVLVNVQGLEELSIQLLEPCDLTFLNQLPNLKSLSLEFQNQEEELYDVLANLTSLEKLTITLHSSKTDLSFLANLSALKELSLTGGDPGELFSDCFVEHTDVLDRLYSLTSLTLKKLNLNDQDIQGLSHLTSLEKLDLSGNTLTDLCSLRNLRDLTYLDLSFNEISDIQVLSNFRKLEELDLSFNEISDITPIQFLFSLTILEIDSNEISDIEGLANLENLSLTDNQIADITLLALLPNLSWLCVNENQMTSIEFLKHLSSLEQLGIEGNPIEDMLTLAQFPALEWVDITDQYGNPTRLYEWEIEEIAEENKCLIK